MNTCPVRITLGRARRSRSIPLTSVDDTRDAITNFEGNVGALSRPNLDNFARVICSTDCSNIYTGGNE